MILQFSHLLTRWNLISFILGVIILQFIPVLPDTWWLLCVLPLFGFYQRKKLHWLLALLLGFIWAYFLAVDRMQQQLPQQLDNQLVVLQGKIVELVEDRGDSVRFIIQTSEIIHLTTKYHEPRRIRISWFRPDQHLSAGERWKFSAKIKLPDSMMNPGGFDYETWLFQKNIQATGYVRTMIPPTRLGEELSIDGLRQKLQQHLQLVLSDSGMSSVVLALVLGDKSSISREQWEVFTQTGTNHLIAISGLHISILAGVFIWIGWKIWWYTPLRHRYSAQKVAAISALIGALIYAALAGFAIPTQRAFIMLAAFSLPYLLNRSPKSMDNLIFAAFLVVLIDPFAVLNAGFWLSFAAVAVIFLGFAGWRPETGWKSLVYQWLKLQLIVSIGIMPILLWLGSVVNPLSPLVNLLSVPLFAVLVVPASLFLSLVSLVDQQVAAFAFQGLIWLLEYWYLGLDWVLAYSQPWLLYAHQSWIGLICLLLAIVLLLSPKGFLAKPLALVLVLPFFFPGSKRPLPGEFWVDVLDVGQGLSTVVRTSQHNLLFDTGTRFKSGFNMGDTVVLPFLRNQNIEHIDLLVLSNGDLDHQGGAVAIADKMPISKMLSGEPDRVKGLTVEHCQKGHSWTWDQVSFTILHPDADSSWQGNNRSCVLSIRSGNTHVLLTADIEKQVEAELVEEFADHLKANLIVVPHHGSATSSTMSFVQMTSPEVAIIPAGRNNQYGFPKSQVLENWQLVGTQLGMTGELGTVMFRLNQLGIDSMVYYRELNQRYWRRGGSGFN